jgi:hypothetical protein
MEVKYTRLVTEGSVAVHSVKSDLTPALSKCSQDFADELVWLTHRQHG